ncbi:hypothetical protein ANO11243_088650 [Dothideomycetidae sp. 11243]|nr:hypothetical protein ANO11243_088650 [fungal sp. No.11243]
MEIKVPLRRDGATTVPLVITNQCQETIFPGIVTQGGTGPGSQGFQLTPGSNKQQTVSSDWQGRVWGRTNCTFNSQGTSLGGGAACTTGDCGGTVNCVATGEVPVTLAEFTLNGSNSQTFYDISLVDGYNLPMAIVTINPSSLPPNKGNPSCVATASSWCPWDLQEFPPTTPNNGVYPYPDTDIARPAFDPCESACAKYRTDKYCCTGSHDGPSKCKPNYYSTSAKTMCPDAYSYAYDDQTSTFITQQGPGFNIIFCPGGRSTKILAQSSSTSGSSSSSGGSFKAWADRSNPILDALVGTSGRAICAGLAAALLLLFS